MEQRDGRSELLRSVLQEFPPVQHAVAYGSGVFAQPGLYSKAHANGIVPNSPMIDLIFAVEDPLQWHRQVCSVHPRIVHMCHAWRCSLCSPSDLVLRIS
jgi:hypothetical protein